MSGGIRDDHQRYTINALTPAEHAAQVAKLGRNVNDAPIGGTTGGKRGTDAANSAAWRDKDPFEIEQRKGAA